MKGEELMEHMKDIEREEIRRRDEILYISYIEKIIEPVKIDTGEFEKNIEQMSSQNISKRNSLKPNLRNSIFLGKNKKDGKFYYYFKTGNNFLTAFILNEEAFKIFNNKDEKFDTKRLKLTSTLIVLYYKKMIKYYHEEVADLEIEDLYKDFNEKNLNRIEKIIKELTIFFTKVYYHYPLYEEREVSEYLEYLMEKYNINAQIEELEKNLNLIREIGVYHLERKEEKTRERWNIIFAVIGIIIAFIEVFLALKG